MLEYNRNKPFLWEIYENKKNMQINDICSLIWENEYISTNMTYLFCN